MTFQEFLEQEDACQPAQEWAQDKSFQEIWDTCGKPSWLMWLMVNLDFKTRTFQELAISSAESVSHLMRDERSKKAVADLRRWLNGENVDLIMVRESSNAARAADSAYAADAAYAADSAYAAADSAYAAARAAANAAADAADAAHAAYAAANAAYAAADAARAAADAADAAARAADAAHVADIIRKHITFEQVAQAAQKIGIELRPK